MKKDSLYSFQDWFSLPIPAVLWHYTSFESFQQIVVSKKIFATDLGYLNDRLEFKSGLAITRNLFRHALWENRLPKDVVIPNYLEKIKTGVLSLEENRVFVASFTDAKDSLSQWRAYSGGSSGVSIGFGLPDSAVRTTSNVFHSTFAPCIYERNSKVNFSNAAFQPVVDLLDEFTSDFAKVLKKSEWAKQGWEGRFTNVERKAGLDLMRICALSKHAKFEEENEWRLVQPVRRGDSSVKFRPRRDTLVPYVEWPISGESGTPRVSHVILGPGHHPNAEEAVESFLLENGIKARVSSSKAPYRAV